MYSGNQKRRVYLDDITYMNPQSIKYPHLWKTMIRIGISIADMLAFLNETKMDEKMNKVYKRQAIRLIKRSEIEKSFGMTEAIEAMAEAFSSLSSGKAFVPKRYISHTPDEALTFLLKPAFVDDHDKSSIKILTQKNRDTIAGLPTILGIVLLIDKISGEIVSIMDGEYITALRTGAASGLATRLLSREDSCKLAIFGCGSQGRLQLAAVDAVRRLEKIWVFDRSERQAQQFVEEMTPESEAAIVFTNDLSVLKDVDIICTATNAEAPLFNNDHLKKGCHINAIGSYKPEMQEIDPEIIRSSLVYFDDREACTKESGDIIRAKKDPKTTPDNFIGEIGEYVLSRIRGRSNTDETTLFKSVGTAIQDFVVADRIYTKSLATGFGTEIRLYE